MRSFHEIEGYLPPQTKLELPPNVLLLATHGSRNVPPDMDLSAFLKDVEFGEARLKDFSDFGTGLIQEHFNPEGIVTPPRYGRIAGDANRRASWQLCDEDDGLPAGKEAFRTTTMAGILPVWDTPPTPLQRAIWLDENHSPYFDKITARITGKLVSSASNLLVVDLHDTGDVRLEADGSTIPSPKRVKSHGRNTFFEAVVSDKDGQTARPVVRDIFMGALFRVYQANSINTVGDVLINDPYKGGYATEFAGIVLPGRLREQGFSKEDTLRINVLQLEIPRHRFMPDEKYQIIDPSLIRNEAIILHKILTEAGNSI